MVDVTGLRKPYIRKFRGETYDVWMRVNTKARAKKIAEHLRKTGDKARIVKIKTAPKYLVYLGENPKKRKKK